MADLRDDSMLFSLNGLLDVQKERVEREEAARKREAELAIALQTERQRLVREAEDRKRQAMAEAARLEELRRREDEARLEALKQASIERARLEVEARAQAEIIERQQAHERRLAEIRGQVAGGANWVAYSGFVLAAACALAAFGLYFGKLRPDSDRLQVAYGELVRAERTRAEETKRLLTRSDERRQALQTDLDKAHARIAELEGRAAAPEPSRPGLSTKSAPPPATQSPPSSQKCTDDGDPMNGCLK